ncbi:MAG: DUF2723 domain-containing protein, partial [Planctomycetes bacterium]|nr:DUF2723 domain-containing protein [Planctomycetota bacterium]
MWDRQRKYVLENADSLCAEDLAEGAGINLRQVREVLKEGGKKSAALPRASRLPFLFPQLSLPETQPLSRADRWVAFACAAVAFLAYALTCTRDISGEDCGELVTAARVLGVAHPPGYPLWCLLGKVFTWIPIGTVAFRVALLSAVCAGVTVGIVALLITRITRSSVAAAAGALLLAFSDDLWSQAIIPEVYTLNTLFLALALDLTWRWYTERTNRLLFALAAVLGLSLTNHSTMGPLLVLFFLFILSVHWNIWRVPGLLPATILAGALPLLLYVYLPIRAEAGTIMNWGNPRTVDAALDHIFRKQYSSEYTASARTVSRTWKQVVVVARDASRQVTPWLGWLAIAGAAMLLKRNWRYGLLLGGIFFACTAGFIVLLNFDPLDRECTAAYRIFYIPAWVVAGIWAGVALQEIVTMLRHLFPAVQPRLAWTACSIAVLPLVLHWRPNDKSHYRVERQYLEAILTTLPDRAMILPSGDHSSFPLIYAQGVEKRRLDIVIVDKYGYTDPQLLGSMPGAPMVGPERIPSADEDQRVQDWVFSHTDRPVYMTTRRSLAELPGYKLV